MSTAVATLPQLTLDQARELTDRIRFALERTWGMLLEAYERGAWVAMGYDRWQDYVETEFSISRQHSYRLLDHGRVVRALQEAAGDVSPAGDIITERDARDIKPFLPEVVESIQEKVAAGAEPAAAVRDAVAEAREAKRDADFSDAVHGIGPALVEDEPAAENEVADILAEQEQRIAELERLNASLSKGDAAAEIARLSQVIGQMDGRVQQLTTTMNAAKDQAERAQALLKRVRAELGVERDRDIIPAIQALRAARAA